MADYPINKFYPDNCYYNSDYFADFDKVDYQIQKEKFDQQYPAKSYRYTVEHLIYFDRHSDSSMSSPSIENVTSELCRTDTFQIYGFVEQTDKPVRLSNLIVILEGQQPTLAAANLDLYYATVTENTIDILKYCYKKGFVDSCIVTIGVCKSEFASSNRRTAQTQGNLMVLKEFAWNFPHPLNVELPDTVIIPGYSLVVFCELKMDCATIKNVWDFAPDIFSSNHSEYWNQNGRVFTTLSANVRILIEPDLKDSQMIEE